MQKHKMKVIAGLVVLVALTVAWLLGGSPDLTAEPLMPQEIAAVLPVAEESELAPRETPQIDAPAQSAALPAADETDSPAAESNAGQVGQTELETTPPQAAQPAPSQQTESSPPPEEPQNQAEDSFSVTLSVRVDSLLGNLHLLDSGKHGLVPANGIIFSQTVTAQAGDSVFDVLQREMRRADIHMMSRFTPGYNSAYVVAIHNIAEFDAGPLSGWLYRVNGQSPGVGSSQHFVSAGDTIVWLYTLDLGRDIG